MSKVFLFSFLMSELIWINEDSLVVSFVEQTLSLFRDCIEHTSRHNYQYADAAQYHIGKGSNETSGEDAANY
ncbi:hypothetical protein BN1088_1432747 [Sphingobacterium sp. PM2-P1-29]|nr:hypothetical protein BN1088_1432747 [Sphingobacterium sp. PM2-P1-29]